MTAAGRVVKHIRGSFTLPAWLMVCIMQQWEQIRANYKDVDKLIAAVKASVVKNKDLKAKFSTINSPPATRSHQMGKLVKGSRILCQKLFASL